MSRARPIKIGDERIWFDTARNGERAKEDHLELLALVEDIDLDDLLDEHVTQGEVIKRIRGALGIDNIPAEIVKKREDWRDARHEAPQCRICGKEGNSTKHHYVNRWILKELVDYAWKWADRNKNTIPVSIKCHRELHKRDGEAKSIAPYLKDNEKDFVEAALIALQKQRPSVALLLARGDDSVYESQLLKDWINGVFRPNPAEIVVPAEARESALA